MNTKNLTALAIFVAVAYVTIVLLSGLGWNPFNASWDFTNPGEFGDSFGPLSTLMAAAAAVAAIAAYVSQRNELRQAKEDAKIERKLSVKRDFEETFFSLLNLFRETVKEIDVEDQYGANPVCGRDAFRRMIEIRLGGASSNDVDDEEKFKKVYTIYRDDLAHYFRLFYHIVKFIDESPLEDKRLYSRLLRATLSNAEIVLIALNCVYGGGKPKLKRLVEKYQMLHNISAGDAKNWRLREKFKKNAFGDRDFANQSAIY